MARYTIGQRFTPIGKHSKECTITDIHVTYNQAGELIKTRYVATHEFLGQTITQFDIPEATIARGAA